MIWTTFMEIFVVVVVVVFGSLTAIATVNCHSMGKHSNTGCMQVLEG